MRLCPKCGKELSDETLFCPGCGTQIENNIEEKEADTSSEIQNNAEVQSGTTEQSASDYEQTSATPKRKKRKLIPILAILALILICVSVGAVKYFSSDAYKYKKALELIDIGEYESAFEKLYALGDYEKAESYLPFNGKYTYVRTETGGNIEFKDGKYTQMVSYDGEDSYYYGTYVVDGYKTAVLTDDDGDKETYKAYKNYIYQSDDEYCVFDGKIDISSGNFDGKITSSYNSNGSTSTGKYVIEIIFKYIFESDGTYKYSTEFYMDDECISSESESGTYEIDGDLIRMTSNEDGDKEAFLVVNGTVYSRVYVRNY